MVPRWMAAQDSRLCQKLSVNRWRRASEVKGQRLTLECSPPEEKDWVSEGCLSLKLSSRVYSSPYHSSGSSNTGAGARIGPNGRKEASEMVC